MTARKAAVPLVLLPGLDGSGTLYGPFRDALARQIQLRIVTYPDCPAWRLDDYVDYVERSLPAGQRSLVVAESFSGPIALQLLRRRSDLAGLVLVASFDGRPNPLLAVVSLLPASLFMTMAKWQRLLRAFCLGDDAPQKAVLSLRNAIGRLSRATLRSRLELLRTLRPVGAAEGAAVPILCLVAGQDRLVLSRAALEGLSRYAAVRRIEGPHFLLQTRATECVAAIEAWLAEKGWTGQPLASGQQRRGAGLDDRVR